MLSFCLLLLHLTCSWCYLCWEMFPLRPPGKPQPRDQNQLSHTHKHRNTHTLKHAHTNPHINSYIYYIYTCTHTHIHIHRYIHIYTHTYTHTQKYIHIRTHKPFCPAGQLGVCLFLLLELTFKNSCLMGQSRDRPAMVCPHQVLAVSRWLVSPCRWEASIVLLCARCRTLPGSAVKVPCLSDALAQATISHRHPVHVCWVDQSPPTQVAALDTTHTIR